MVSHVLVYSEIHKYAVFCYDSNVFAQFLQDPRARNTSLLVILRRHLMCFCGFSSLRVTEPLQGNRVRLFSCF